LALYGGIDSPIQLGSRSTYQRALIGGIDGQPIMVGNQLRCSDMRQPDYCEYKAEPWTYADAPVRVVLGPQEGHFQNESITQFLNSGFKVSTQIDRMGVRLEGHPLIHTSPAAADIVSDGVTPGAIQVPGNGHPIILLADCQTVGGYPKIASVISADLPRLGQLRPGQTISFQAVNLNVAKNALLEREAQWSKWASGIVFDVQDSSAFSNDISTVWTASEA
ncbi:MAG: biotin-dependent carboxyltransferase family protein, partial [Betaproteobacteria bacterium]